MKLKHTADNDSSLSIKIKNGEKLAFKQLFDRYAPRIYNFSLSYLSEKDDAEELVQEVFLKIWEKREMLDPSKNIKAFVFKIAVNIIYDFVRRRNIEQAFADYSKLQFKPDENFTWHDVIFNEMQQNLDKFLKQLPVQQQKIFRLNKIEGYSSSEIAKEMNLSKRTVENHLYRAISALKEHFKSESIIAILYLFLVCG